MNARAAPSPAPRSRPAPPPDQRPPVTFKTQINLVEVDAIVTDRSGRFVTDLTKIQVPRIRPSKKIDGIGIGMSPRRRVMIGVTTDKVRN
jgi:hypothetical protein